MNVANGICSRWLSAARDRTAQMPSHQNSDLKAYHICFAVYACQPAEDCEDCAVDRTLVQTVATAALRGFYHRESGRCHATGLEYVCAKQHK